jgi:hypothetical protein
MAERGDNETTSSGPTAPQPSQLPADTPAVFISYSSQGVAAADAVVRALERQGFFCWIAPRDVTPGEFHADAIVRALNASRLSVLLLSENALGSPHVLREVERTSSKRHPIISIWMGVNTLSPSLEYFLSASHWLDAGTSGIESALPRLVEAVQLRFPRSRDFAFRPGRLPSTSNASRRRCPILQTRSGLPTCSKPACASPATP